MDFEKVDTRFWDRMYDDYENNGGPLPPRHPEKTHSWNIKLWQIELKNYQDGKGPKPGPHPIDDHDFNTKPELFLT